ncbi:adenosylcobinamide amidohydrolase [Labilibaculum sp.]|uniref:adenosylcobinamide amidohydrolase n=1 Tax=Labilibaculum sp. TaxID=2060723 RepID=UPI002AA6F521|nr:adenosylcobinamide amidohydrolase [Labilibaculum sp.]
MKFSIEITDQFFHVEFQHSVRMVSSAILNGGCQIADHFLNTKVDANFNGERTDFESPDITLKEIVDSQNWEGNCVGMMTAALMSSFRRVRVEKQGVWIEVFVTSGVSNARRAGDEADYQFVNEEYQKVGTINILVTTNANLSDASMIECVMMVAEAKVACLQDLNIKSPVSGLLATGTGTDSTAIACGTGPMVQYCGKHVLFGEMLAKTTYKAIQESLSVAR